MTDPTTQPIHVTPTAIPGSILLVIRYGLVFGSAFGLSRLSMFSGSEVLLGCAVALIGAALSLLWGILNWIKQHAKLKAMANMLDDDQAVVK